MLSKIATTIKKHRTAYLFLLPTAVLVLGFLISPIVSGTVMSLYKARLSGATKFVGLQNFMKLFNEARFLNNVKLTLLYVLGNILLSTPLAYVAAILITQKMKAANFFRGIFLLPWITAPVVSSLLVLSLLDPSRGLVTTLVKAITGHSVVILANPVLSMFVVILHSFWRSFPFMMLFLAAGLASIPNEIYEAAKVDGTTGWQRFWFLTFPMTRIHLAMVMLVVSMWTAQDTETVYALTGGGPGYSTEVLAVRMLKGAFINFNLYSGAVIGVLLILMSLGFMFVYLRLFAGMGGEEA
ncbi:MAG: sugar ABC transporter permease [bacterium]|nr:sugar ABC transporter permease [bacterium]